MVAEEANLWLVVGQENLLGLRSKWPRARHVKPCVESFGSKFLVVPSAAEENTVPEPLKPVEEDRSKECDERQEGEADRTTENRRETNGKAQDEGNDPEAAENLDGVSRHGWLPV